MPVLRLLKVSADAASESLKQGTSLYAEAVEDCLLRGARTSFFLLSELFALRFDSWNFSRSAGG